MKINDKMMIFLKASEKFNDENYDLDVFPDIKMLKIMITRKDNKRCITLECFYDRIEIKNEEECIKFYIELFNKYKDLLED